MFHSLITDLEKSTMGIGPTLRAWQGLFLFWTTVVLLVAVNCYAHGQLVAETPHAFTQSLGWAGAYWYNWAWLTPFILRLSKPLLEKGFRLRLIAKHLVCASLYSLLALFIAYGLELIVAAPGAESALNQAFANKLFDEFYLGLVIYSLIMATGCGLLIVKGRREVTSNSVSKDKTATKETKELGGSLLVSRGREKVPLKVAELEVVTAAGNYLELHSNGQTYLLRCTLKNLEKQLDTGRFVRIHRSTLVAMSQIQAIAPRAGGEYRVQLKNGQSYTLSKSYRAELKARLDSRLRGKKAA